MNSVELSQRLSRINTLWTMVFQAHAASGDQDEVQQAQCILLERYRGAIFRYLLGAVRDAEAAEELAQEFALRFVRGDFRRADPKKGRFRNYLKTSLSRLVTDHHRARQQAPGPLAPSVIGGAPAEDDEPSFAANWRQELLERTWQALAEFNPTYHAALHLRIEDPELPSAQMAAQLSEQLGKPISAALVRKSLQRAHDKFADLLLDEVALSLETSSPSEMEQELKELDLLRFCRSALERRKS
jgi:RNA polymerase sigma-70 factor (ECF subfamily)